MMIKIDITLNTTKILALLSFIAVIVMSIYFQDPTVFNVGLPVIASMVLVRDAFGKEKKQIPKQEDSEAL